VSIVPSDSRIPWISYLVSPSVGRTTESRSGEKTGVRSETGPGAGESLSDEDCDCDEAEN
jgi:hypothetical protein